VKSADAVGFHSCFLISEIRSDVSYPLLFDRVLRNLSMAYCEEWAQILMGQKIQPLRELLEMENYSATNEVNDYCCTEVLKLCFTLTMMTA